MALLFCVLCVGICDWMVVVYWHYTTNRAFSSDFLSAHLFPGHSLVHLNLFRFYPFGQFLVLKSTYVNGTAYHLTDGVRNISPTLLLCI
jgi:uncharacterized membrane protein (DUF485 family)